MERMVRVSTRGLACAMLMMLPIHAGCGPMDNTGGEMTNTNMNDNAGGMMATADIASGERLVADNCAACHGADGASGFAANIQGASTGSITTYILGEAEHPVIDLSEQEVADISAYLGSL